MSELGPRFQERVYKNALFMAMMHKGLQVNEEHSYEVICIRIITYNTF